MLLVGTTAELHRACEDVEGAPALVNEFGLNRQFRARGRTAQTQLTMRFYSLDESEAVHISFESAHPLELSECLSKYEVA